MTRAAYDTLLLEVEALRSLDAGAVREATIQECARVAMNPKLFEHYTDGPLALCGGVVDAILALGQINAAAQVETLDIPAFLRKWPDDPQEAEK